MILLNLYFNIYIFVFMQFSIFLGLKILGLKILFYF